MVGGDGIRWDDRGVSQVIGVVLLVAITVVLAGTIAALVLGFGGSNPSQSPSFADDTSFDDRLGGNGQYLNVTHDGGAKLDPDHVRLAVDGATVSPGGADATLASNVFASQVGSEFVATDTLVVDRRAFSNVGANEHVDLTGATVRLVYSPGEAEETAIIYECDVAYPDCETR
ncbi:type IV pilin [Halobacteriales archaeon Cl-PHB]